MKKIPYLLLALTLSSVGAALLSSVAQGTELETYGGAVITDEAKAKALSLVAPRAQAVTLNSTSGAPGDINDFTPNTSNSWAKVGNVSLRNNSISVSANAGMNYPWQAGKVIVAQLDYENGVTEEEADVHMSGLGVEDVSDWAVILGETDVSGLYVASATIGLKDRNVLDNLTDRVYYAVQFGHKVVDENGETKFEDTWWVRGKADYRRCVRSTVFQSDAMTCEARPVLEDGAETGRLAYLPYHFRQDKFYDIPDDEYILTWEEAWRNTLAERYQGLRDEIEIFDGYLRETLPTFERLGQGLEQLKKGLAGVSATMGGYVSLTDAEQDKLAKLKADYLMSQGTATDTEELEILRTKIAALESEKDELARTNQTLSDEKNELEQTKLALEGEKEELLRAQERLQEVNSGLEKEKSELELIKQGLEQEISNLKANMKPEENSKIQELQREIARLERELELARNSKPDNDAKDDNKADKAPNVDDGEKNESLPEKPVSGEVNGSYSGGTEAGGVATGNQDMNNTSTNEAGGAVKVIESSQEEDKGQNLKQNQNQGQTKGEETEVPKLGGAKPFKNVYWFTIPVVGVLIGLGVWVKRMFFGRR